MKLRVPQTWETQVALLGNRANVWQDLIGAFRETCFTDTHWVADAKKLPFMAMLRNLRNLIKTGVSDAHHKLVLRRLRDERQVIQSRQFPFRFFAAYQVLEELRTNMVKHEEANAQFATMNTSSSTGPSSVRTPASRVRGRVNRQVKTEEQKKKAIMRTLNR
jgi:telomerase protein component 1